MIRTPEHLYGFHDSGGERIISDRGLTGWVVLSTKVEDLTVYETPPVIDYESYRSKAIVPIVRLNHGYYPYGTIPGPDNKATYEFAKQCANHVTCSIGCHHWIIGNEPNHIVERPQGVPIMPWHYAGCYAMCRNLIRSTAGHENDQVIIAAIAPWDCSTTYPTNPTGDWLQYLEDMLVHIGADCDGLAIHAYTHGHDRNLIWSTDTMELPFQDRYYEWPAYRQQLEHIPEYLRHLPIYITEADQIDPWVNENSGWVEAAYADINWWNQQEGTQKIVALCLYRWQGYDKWSIQDKPGVIEDFQAALAMQYRLPQVASPGTTGVTTAPLDTESLRAMIKDIDNEILHWKVLKQRAQQLLMKTLRALRCDSSSEGRHEEDG